MDLYRFKYFLANQQQIVIIDPNFLFLVAVNDREKINVNRISLSTLVEHSI
jgi:hypothetical protein